MLHGLFGGALIGLAATIYWLFAGHPAGISGIVAGALREREARTRRVTFLAGLIVAGVIAAAFAGTSAAASTPPAVLAAGGLLVGFGTRVGGGCTSGHGVCGLARFSPASAVAVGTFMVTGVATVAAVALIRSLAGTTP